MDAYKAIVITPVKNSLENTLETIKAIKESQGQYLYFVYDDFSDTETSVQLKEKSAEQGVNYIHLSELTNTPSPNYFTVLKDAQAKSLQHQLPLIIVESDVVVQKNTLQELLSFVQKEPKIGMVGAVTVDYDNKINFPYLKFESKERRPIATERSLSFCCTLLSIDFLQQFSFNQLDQGKDWFDTSISNASLSHGFKNYVLLNIPVLHKPHGSRPWKQLKYTNPLKYYWLKFTKGRDKI